MTNEKCRESGTESIRKFFNSSSNNLFSIHTCSAPPPSLFFWDAIFQISIQKIQDLFMLISDKSDRETQALRLNYKNGWI